MISGTALCVKTPKGIEEVEKRTCALPFRVRRVLIMVDGKRDANELAAMFPNDDVPAILENLLSESFLVPLVAAAPKRSAPAPVDEAQRFDMGRNFMVNTVNAYLGVMGSALLDKLERCTEFAELRALYPEWRDAIRLSGEGRKQADDLEFRLAALIS